MGADQASSGQEMFTFLGGKDTFDFFYDPEWNVTTSVDESALLAKLDLAAADTTGIPQGFLGRHFGGIVM